MCQRDPNIINCFHTLKIRLNLGKTQRLFIPKGNNPHINYECLNNLCPISNSMKILGVIFNNSLTWSDHIDYTIKKCSKNLYILRYFKHCLSKNQLITIFNSLIQSNFDYCCTLYHHSLTNNDTRKIDSIYRRSHLIICGPTCNHICLSSPHTRRTILSKKLFTNISTNNSHILHSHLPNLLPSGRRYNIPFSRTTRRIKSFFISQAIVSNLSL